MRRFLRAVYEVAADIGRVIRRRPFYLPLRTADGSAWGVFEIRTGRWIAYAANEAMAREWIAHQSARAPKVSEHYVSGGM